MPSSPPPGPHQPRTTRPRPSGHGASTRSSSLPGDRRAAVARVQFRRALALLVMTLLVPGSAQLVAGRKQVGRLAIRVWLGVLGTLAFVVLLSLLWHGFAFWAATSGFVLGLLRLVLSVLAIGWALLFIDAWRLGQPLELRQKQRLAVVGLNGALCFGVAGTLLFASHLVAVQKDFLATMFGGGTVSSSHHGRYNVLLIGGDSGTSRWGLRTDSLTVASIDEDTGKTVLFSLPRNMTNFPFPEGSVMADQWPDGYDCDECLLNSLATWAADNKTLFKGYDDPQVEATIEGVEGITGLKVNYWAMVNLPGFRGLVDAMGGLTLNVRDRIPVGVPVNRYLEPGVRKLNGEDTLWFARSRESADDYSRMARQKCVMNAMLQQLSPTTVVTKFEAIAKASEDMVRTNLPASELDRFIDLALKARGQRIATVSFVPPAIVTADPDIDKIHAMVTKAIDRSEGKAKPAKAGGTGFSKKKGTTTGGSLGSMGTGYAANEATDLSSVC